MLNGFGDVDGALAQVRAYDPGAIHDGADMSKVEQIEAMVRRCETELGSCDILVNNAGIQHVAPIEDFPVERWDAIIAINLSAAFHAMRVALPGMQKRNWGRIINVASAHGLVASAQKSAYVAAKHGIVGLTKVAALENATTGVTVNAICPGWVLTPLVQKQVDARAPPPASTTKRPSAACWPRSNPRCSSPRRNNWPSWRCSCARRRRQRPRRGLARRRRLDRAVNVDLASIQRRLSAATAARCR
jgi:NAD(P)-dependent dehydrogenase (short-subunit alcohol dehydrogenase family)